MTARCCPCGIAAIDCEYHRPAYECGDAIQIAPYMKAGKPAALSASPWTRTPDFYALTDDELEARLETLRARLSGGPR